MPLEAVGVNVFQCGLIQFLISRTHAFPQELGGAALLSLKYPRERLYSLSTGTLAFCAASSSSPLPGLASLDYFHTCTQNWPFFRGAGCQDQPGETKNGRIFWIGHSPVTF